MWADKHICRNNCATAAEDKTLLRSDPDVRHFNVFGKTCIVPLKGFKYASGNHMRHTCLTAAGETDLPH